jgi:hypothetical protein
LSPPSDDNINLIGIDRGSGEGWPEYRKLVLNELERIEKDIRSLHDKFDALKATIGTDMSAMQVQIAMLKVKAGMVGAMTGAVTGLAVAIGAYLMHGMK